MEPMDELEAVKETQCIVKWLDGRGYEEDYPAVIRLQTLRALLARATRAHD